MKKYSYRLAFLGALISSWLLAGCATNQVAVKEVVANPDAHLAKFAPAVLQPPVLAQLPKGEPALGFSRIEVEMELKETPSEQKSERSLTSRSVFLNAGNGLVQSYHEIRNNQIPFRMNYRLSYRGFMPLKWQTVFLGQHHSGLSNEVRTITRFDAVPARAGSSPLEYAFTFGSEIQLANFSNGREVCSLGNRRPAGQVHPSLQGDVLDLACDNYSTNGVVGSKSTFWYLERYGVAINQSYVSSRTRNTFQIKSIQIQ
jgi:hypothetical protein